MTSVDWFDWVKASGTAIPMQDDGMNEVCVSNWNELNDELYEQSWRESSDDCDPTMPFRGLADARDNLKTRFGAPGAELERHILRNFRKCYHEAVTADTIWNGLAAAQHHALPTRWLDWTYSPYVTLHVVTKPVDHVSNDGVIW